jgi:hypothetical protein
MNELLRKSQKFFGVPIYEWPSLRNLGNLSGGSFVNASLPKKLTFQRTIAIGLYPLQLLVYR